MIVYFLLTIIGIMLILHYKQKEALDELTDEYTTSIAKHRSDAIKQSKAVIRGKVSEEFIPLFPDFPYNLSDCKFSGQPIDYLIFNGMSNVRDDSIGEIEIIFADVKVNSATKTKVQRAIENAIKEGRVRFETWNIKDNKIIIK